jgi:CBS domain-containing protein
VEPLEFLRLHPPFDRLADTDMAVLSRSLEITYHPRDSKILRRGGPRSQHLYVVRKGSVRLERDGQLVQTIEEGECFGFPSLIGRTAPHVDAIVAEDTLLYQVPEQAFGSLMQARAFADFFLADLSQRLRRSMSVQSLPIGGELGTPVGRLPVTPPITLAPTLTAGDAARRMREAGVSAVLVEGDPPGILTDSDLRGKVLAEGRGPETQLGEIATRPIRTVSADTTLFETLVFMLEHHIHHAPLERDGQLTGILADTDLLRLHVKSPLYLLRNIERLRVPHDLPRYPLELSAMVEALLWGGLDATQVGPVVSRLNDALVGRLLRHAESEIGDPPVPYASRRSSGRPTASRSRPTASGSTT